MGDYTLADMPYDYAALEPAITGEILELHHAKHSTGTASSPVSKPPAAPDPAGYSAQRLKEKD